MSRKDTSSDSLSLSQALDRQRALERRRDRLPEGRQATLKKEQKKKIEEHQLELLRVQQGLWQRKARAIVVFEGFDAAGKGGCIRRLTEMLDPRGVAVHPIGPPTAREQGTHWLYRFWARLPEPGTLAIFDRSWYGRVLVERVEKLTPKPAWKRAYREIVEFERMLADDGVDILKFFLAVSPEEQLKRFRERLENPYKRWKLGMADVEARARWNDYVVAADALLERTSTRQSPWHVIPSDDKTAAHLQVLEMASRHFSHHREWVEAQKDFQLSRKEVKRALKLLERAHRGA